MVHCRLQQCSGHSHRNDGAQQKPQRLQPAWTPVHSSYQYLRAHPPTLKGECACIALPHNHKRASDPLVALGLSGKACCTTVWHQALPPLLMLVLRALVLQCPRPKSRWTSDRCGA